jgi:hypothetical protein
MAAEQPPQSFARSEFLVVVMIYSTDTLIKSGFEQHAPPLFAARDRPRGRPDKPQALAETRELPEGCA